jgi:hypothetical protein
MTVGKTHSEITTHPTKMGVTTATERGTQQYVDSGGQSDTRLIDSSHRQDVERKLKLYGVIQALGDGRMPDNNQVR